MSHIGLSEAQQRAVLGLVAAVLHLGNIAFRDGEHASVGGGAEGAVVPPGAPRQALEAAAELLGVGAGALAEALTTRQIQTPEGEGGGSKGVRRAVPSMGLAEFT